MTSANVLIIEDNVDDAYLIQNMMRSDDSALLQIQRVSCLKDAIAHIDTAAVDVILLDLALPDSKGLSALMALQTCAPTLPIVVLTGFNDDELGIQAVQAGAQDYLVKGQVDKALLTRSLYFAIERKRMEQHLQQRTREIEALYQQVSALEQLKTDMIRIAAHDIGGLLNIACGHLYMLMEVEPDPLTEAQQHSLNEINHSLQRMTMITKDILSLERIEAQQTPQAQSVDLSDLVEQLANQYQSHANSKQQQLAARIVPSITVLGDAVQLQEAIANLLTNALKYTPEHGSIQVQLHQRDNVAILEVQDSGYGIPTELQANLFQPFYRAKTKDTSHIAGTGLGLHLVKNIIERHHGRMVFNSVYGTGSMFGFQLPIAIAMENAVV